MLLLWGGPIANMWSCCIRVAICCNVEGAAIHGYLLPYLLRLQAGYRKWHLERGLHRDPTTDRNPRICCFRLLSRLKLITFQQKSRAACSSQRHDISRLIHSVRSEQTCCRYWGQGTCGAPGNCWFPSWTIGWWRKTWNWVMEYETTIQNQKDSKGPC